MELLEFILSTTYFWFNGQIYRQKFGTAMGSPVSPLVANMFMEHLERKLLDTAPASRKCETEIMEKVCGRHSRDCKERLSGKTHRVYKWTGWLSQHKVHIRSGTRWPVTISRFAVKQDRKWWLEATGNLPTLISIWTSALITALNINWVWWEPCWKEVSASLQRLKIENRKISM